MPFKCQAQSFCTLVLLANKERYISKVKLSKQLEINRKEKKLVECVSRWRLIALTRQICTPGVIKIQPTLSLVADENNCVARILLSLSSQK